MLILFFQITWSVFLHKKSQKYNICVLEKVRNPKLSVGEEGAGRKGNRDRAEDKAQSEKTNQSTNLEKLNIFQYT